MDGLLYSPMFGILISILAFQLGVYINKKTKLIIMNPLMLAIVFVIILLVIGNIDIEAYSVGGDMINMFLGPATVVLAVPLYRQIEYLKKYAGILFVGIGVGTLCGLISILLMTHFMNLEQSVAASLMPKSITTPIGVEVSAMLGGIPSITIVAILLTGLIGAVCAPFVLKFFKIQHPMAKGIAIGTSAHALGTTKALEMGEVEGAMSSLSIGIAGILTVFLAPFIWQVFQLILK